MTDLRLNFKLIAAFCSIELNQMTNVPVNTHLIFGPTLCTKTSFAKFDIVRGAIDKFAEFSSH